MLIIMNSTINHILNKNELYLHNLIENYNIKGKFEYLILKEKYESK